MSFKVDWDSLETDSLRNWTKELLRDALNSGKRSSILASKIEIKDLNFGKIAPDFEILEIGELDRDRFRGIFKINYDGDFHLTLHTKVQANPFRMHSCNSRDKEVSMERERFVTPEFLMADDPFALPLDLKLSDIKINGIAIVVFSKTKGLTLVFRNDPLVSIKVSSTFDTVQVIADFLQKQIEAQIRELFRETLPTLLHHLSLKYTSENQQDILNIHSKLSRAYESKLVDVNVTYSANNLHKNMNLFNSRESLKINIPRIKNMIQRTHLDKYDKNIPNLHNSLNMNLNLSEFKTPDSTNNGIPIEYLTKFDSSKMTDILTEISSLQSTNYYKSNSNNSVRPTRRKVKLGFKSQKPEPQPESISRTQSISPTNTGFSNISTLVEDSFDVSQQSTLNLKQPQPLRLATEGSEARIKHAIQHHPSLQPSHMNSPSSNFLLSSVGLGSNYFNLNNGQQFSMSPIRRESEMWLKEKEKDAAESSGDRDRKSLNYMHVNKLNAAPASLAQQGLKSNGDIEKTRFTTHADSSSNKKQVIHENATEILKIARGLKEGMLKSGQSFHTPPQDSHAFMDVPPPPYC